MHRVGRDDKHLVGRRATGDELERPGGRPGQDVDAPHVDDVVAQVQQDVREIVGDPLGVGHLAADREERVELVLVDPGVGGDERIEVRATDEVLDDPGRHREDAVVRARAFRVVGHAPVLLASAVPGDRIRRKSVGCIQLRALNRTPMLVRT